MIREAIKAELKNRGIKQAEMCRILEGKITPAQLSNFLKGKTSINTSAIDAILNHLKLKIVKIYGNE